MGLIEIIQHHMPISHCPCRRRSIGPLPSCFIIDIDFDILSFHLAFHCSEYNGYHIFVWIYGVSHGGYVYAFKMYIFEKVRARNFARAWGFAQMAMGIPTLVGIPAASEFFLVQAGFASGFCTGDYILLTLIW